MIDGLKVHGDDPWVSAAAAADWTGRSYRSVQSWIRSGALASRTNSQGTVEVPLYAVIRLSKARRKRDDQALDFDIGAIIENAYARGYADGHAAAGSDERSDLSESA